MTKNEKLGQQIKAFRLERGWTQARMAGFVGVSRPLLSRLENGKGKLLDLTKAKIERQLNAHQQEAVA